MVTNKKWLNLDWRPKKNIYIKDIAEFAQVLLTTTKMIFNYGWQHIQLLFYCQLTTITASYLKALLYLYYHNIGLTLIQDPDGGRPRLFIFLKPDFIKRFFGKKAA